MFLKRKKNKNYIELKETEKIEPEKIILDNKPILNYGIYKIYLRMQIKLLNL